MAHQQHETRSRGVKYTTDRNMSVFLTEPFAYIDHPTPEALEAHYRARAVEEIAKGAQNVRLVTLVTRWKGANGKRTTTYEDVVPIAP